MAGAEIKGEKLGVVREFTEKRTACPGKNKGQEIEEDEDEDIELSLGLSMNGRFGVDPTRNKKLKRSSSIANVAFAGETGAGADARGAGFEVHAPLSRTWSLPAETEEEWRRRKELQSRRRMEARKKRMEKLKNLRVPRDKGESSRDANGGENGLPEFVNGDSIGQRSMHGIESSSQGSIGPLRSGSSGSSDLIEGRKQNAEVSPSSRQSSNGHMPTGWASETEAKGGATSHQLKATMRDMPYVTTKETGPNGRRVEGFLYGYKKGEDVRIMCVCHGTFLTPKEFVEHGGSRAEVEHPLKHIVVNPFPLL